MLRTAPDVGKIFVLIKAKNKEAATDRLKTEVAFLKIGMFSFFLFFLVLFGGAENKIYFFFLSRS